MRYYVLVTGDCDIGNKDSLRDMMFLSSSFLGLGYYTLVSQCHGKSSLISSTQYSGNCRQESRFFIKHGFIVDQENALATTEKPLKSVKIYLNIKLR